MKPEFGTLVYALAQDALNATAESLYALVSGHISEADKTFIRDYCKSEQYALARVSNEIEALKHAKLSEVTERVAPTALGNTLANLFLQDKETPLSELTGVLERIMCLYRELELLGDQFANGAEVHTQMVNVLTKILNRIVTVNEFASQYAQEIAPLRKRHHIRDIRGALTQ